MQQDVTEQDAAPSRRRVLGGAAAGAAGMASLAVLTACGGGSGSAASGEDTSGSQGSASPTAAASKGATVVPVKDVPVGGAVVVPFRGQPVVVSLKTASTPTAFSAICTHAGCTVAPQGAKLVCPCHGSVFDSFTGAVQPGSQATINLPQIRVAISNGNIVTA